MPLYRRAPKLGFKNPFRVEYATVNVDSLEGAFDDGASVGPAELAGKSLIRANVRKVKILGNGEITKKLTVKAHKFSRTAEEKIRGAGGAIEVI
jgi:large subunit ribosomal protein L15